MYELFATLLLTRIEATSDKLQQRELAGFRSHRKAFSRLVDYDKGVRSGCIGLHRVAELF